MLSSTVSHHSVPSDDMMEDSLPRDQQPSSSRVSNSLLTSPEAVLSTPSKQSNDRSSISATTTPSTTISNMNTNTNTTTSLTPQHHHLHSPSAPSSVPILSSSTVGPQISGYVLGGVIGVGTYGEVRYGIQVETNQRCAVKIVDINRFNEETVSLMRKEIKIMKMINHENCIKILDVKENVAYPGHWCSQCACTNFRRLPNDVCSHCAHGGCDHTSTYETRQVMFIVQELALGGELFGLLMHTGPLEEPVARFYFKQLMAGLKHIHSLGIAHRDLKPENLVLSSDFNLKIVDFGLASLSSASKGKSGSSNHDTTSNSSSPLRGALLDEMTAADSLSPPESDHSMQDDIVHHSGVGSQPYSAPECLYKNELYGGKPYSGIKADIWSSAVVLFVMLTGRPPFLRPLLKTYGTHMRRCKHFINIVKGNGLDVVSPSAKSLLQSIFQMQPENRPSIDQILKHPWLNEPVPDIVELSKIMEDKAKKVWIELEKTELLAVLTHMRRRDELPNQASPASTPFGSPCCTPQQSPSLIPAMTPQQSSIPASPLSQSQETLFHSLTSSMNTEVQLNQEIPDNHDSQVSNTRQERSLRDRTQAPAIPGPGMGMGIGVFSAINGNINTALTAFNSNSETNTNVNSTVHLNPVDSDDLNSRQFKSSSDRDTLPDATFKNIESSSPLMSSSPSQGTTLFKTLSSCDNAPLNRSPLGTTPSSPKSASIMAPSSRQSAHHRHSSRGSTSSSLSTSPNQSSGLHINSSTSSNTLISSPVDKRSRQPRVPFLPPVLAPSSSYPAKETLAPQFHGYSRMISTLPMDEIQSIIAKRLDALNIGLIIEPKRVGKQTTISMGGQFQGTNISATVRIMRVKVNKGYEFLIDVHKTKGDLVSFHGFFQQVFQDLKK